jgi:hypothetical protein
MQAKVLGLLVVACTGDFALQPKFLHLLETTENSNPLCFNSCNVFCKLRQQSNRESHAPICSFGSSLRHSFSAQKARNHLSRYRCASFRHCDYIRRIFPSTISMVNSLDGDDAEPVVEFGDVVTINFLGTHLDGIEFQSTRDGEPYEFELGARQVVKGIENMVTRNSQLRTKNDRRALI